MPFEKINAREKLNEKINNDSAFAKTYYSSKKEFDLIKDVIKTRKSLGYSQGELAHKIGIKQQVISRLETKESSPTLKTFMKILDSLGLEITLTKKKDSENSLTKQKI